MFWFKHLSSYFSAQSFHFIVNREDGANFWKYFKFKCVALDLSPLKDLK